MKIQEVTVGDIVIVKCRRTYNNREMELKFLSYDDRYGYFMKSCRLSVFEGIRIPLTTIEDVEVSEGEWLDSNKNPI